MTAYRDPFLELQRAAERATAEIARLRRDNERLRAWTLHRRLPFWLVLGAAVIGWVTVGFLATALVVR